MKQNLFYISLSILFLHCVSTETKKTKSPNKTSDLTELNVRERIWGRWIYSHSEHKGIRLNDFIPYNGFEQKLIVADCVDSIDMKINSDIVKKMRKGNVLENVEVKAMDRNSNLIDTYYPVGRFLENSNFSLLRYGNRLKDVIYVKMLSADTLKISNEKIEYEAEGDMLPEVEHVYVKLRGPSSMIKFPDKNILAHNVNVSNEQIAFFSRDEAGLYFKNHGSLKKWLSSKNKQLIFAMNGGMYMKDLSPQGLYIEQGKLINELDTLQEGFGNFYLKPNGVFYIKTDGTADICVTENYLADESIEYATQSGPMLLVDGKLHTAFNEGSKNVHIRNGVGILPDGNLLFAMSKKKINFYEFANFFKINGCHHALYLDGFVSRTYLPTQYWEQLDGQFGIIIAVTQDELSKRQ